MGKCLSARPIFQQQVPAAVPAGNWVYAQVGSGVALTGVDVYGSGGAITNGEYDSYGSLSGATHKTGHHRYVRRSRPDHGSLHTHHCFGFSQPESRSLPGVTNTYSRNHHECKRRSGRGYEAPEWFLNPVRQPCHVWDKSEQCGVRSRERHGNELHGQNLSERHRYVDNTVASFDDLLLHH